MTISRSKMALLASAVVSLPLLLTACADKVDESQAQAFTVAQTDDSCEVSGTETTTGVSSFTVTNNGSKINEFYVFTQAGRVVGEVENIGPGVTRKLMVQINDPGDYVMTCKPGMVGEGISTPLKVTGDAIDAVSGDAALAEAVEGYTTYVRNQVAALVEQTDQFVDVIDAGNLDEAKRLYPLVRTPYERIEPVAEAFPDDLDPRLDLREADLEAGDTWTGFHAIEKDLFEAGAISDKTKEMAAQLKKDVAELSDGVNASDFQLTAVQIASGAQGLLDEIATGKITGEEDIFSGTDLYDFQANLDGSKQAIASLEKALKERDDSLLASINERFADVQTLLDTYRTEDGFVNYNDVTEPERKALSDALDVLTEKVATVQEVIAQPSK